MCRHDDPLAARRDALLWEALLPFPFIADGLCAQIEHQVLRRLLDGSRLMVRNTTSLLALVRVRARAGLTVLPRLVVARSPDELVFLPLADQRARRRIHLLRLTQPSPSPVAQRFEAAIRHAARELVDDWRLSSGLA